MTTVYCDAEVCESWDGSGGCVACSIDVDSEGNCLSFADRREPDVNWQIDKALEEMHDAVIDGDRRWF